MTSATISVRLSALHVQLARQDFTDDKAGTAAAPAHDRARQVRFREEDALDGLQDAPPPGGARIMSMDPRPTWDMNAKRDFDRASTEISSLQKSKIAKIRIPKLKNRFARSIAKSSEPTFRPGPDPRVHPRRRWMRGSAHDGRVEMNGSLP
jgi:hypothetical protein